MTGRRAIVEADGDLLFIRTCFANDLYKEPGAYVIASIKNDQGPGNEQKQVNINGQPVFCMYPDQSAKHCNKKDIRIPEV